MNHVLSKNQAAGSVRLARLVRHGVVACVLACTAAGAMAGWQDRSPRREDMQQMRERYDSRAHDPRYESRQDARAYEMQMQEEARRRAMDDQARMQRGDDGSRRMRMTPDERSELKRQINEANRDLYPNARRR